MRKARMIGLVGLMTVGALVGTVRAEEAPAMPVTTTTPPLPAAPPRARERRVLVSVSFLPMALGTFTASYGGMRIPSDAAFAPGASATVGYQVVRRYLSVGVAPQVIWNVGTKVDPSGAGNAVVMSKEIDVMARVVGSLPLAEGISVYLEVLPGYSLIMPSEGNTAKGPVLAAGVGIAMDLTDRLFVNLSGGVQRGFATRVDTSVIEMKTTKVTTDVRADYYRVALGVGMRF